MNSRSGARWEFRCWPPAELATRIAAQLDSAADWQRLPDERRTDTYLLPPGRPDLMPKLRGGERFEIKRRLEVRDRLQLWEMALSEDWLLDGDARRRATALFGNDASVFATGTDALAALDWTVGRIEKKRRRWERDRTTVEVTDTTLGWCLAWEGQDRCALLASINRLGLASLSNRSYRAALEASEA